VLAGGEAGDSALAYRVEQVTRRFRLGREYVLDQYGRNASLTDAGFTRWRERLGARISFRGESAAVRGGSGFAACAWAAAAGCRLPGEERFNRICRRVQGRIVPDRRWPAGLHNAVEAKEGVAAKAQGRILGSITVQNLIALYPQVCGMTGTAATQARELRAIYGLDVEVIATNRPVIRVDLPDRLFQTRKEKEQAALAEILRIHETGQPVLIGTASVEESERLSAGMGGLPHEVLNARNEEQEAAIIARAGERGAVTVSTNMAGRGVDIRLGVGVAELGGLQVLGLNRHESGASTTSCGTRRTPGRSGQLAILCIA